MNTNTLTQQSSIRPELAVQLAEQGYLPQESVLMSREEADVTFRTKMHSRTSGILLKQGLVGISSTIFNPETKEVFGGIRVGGNDLTLSKDDYENFEVYFLDPSQSIPQMGFSLKDGRRIEKENDCPFYWNIMSAKNEELSRVELHLGEDNQFFKVPASRSRSVEQNEFWQVKKEDLSRMWNLIGSYLNLKMTPISIDEQDSAESAYGNPVFEGEHKSGIKFRFGTRKRVHLFSGSFPQKLPKSEGELFTQDCKSLDALFKNGNEPKPFFTNNKSAFAHISRGFGGRQIYTIAKSMIDLQERLYK